MVTGGSRGLGRAMALGYAARGATVVVASRKLAACEAVAQEAAAAGAAKALPLACHVGRWQDCDQLVRRVLEECGRIDVLVNNAGMSPLYPSFADVDEALFDKVLEVNLKGAWRLSVLAGDRMKQAGGGTILNISSIAAVQPTARELPYAVAKAGLNTLTVGLAHALGPEVRVNAIMPGAFQTDATAGWPEAAVAELSGTQVPLRRLGKAGEIVAAALHLTGESSTYTTGAILKIDGGLAWAPA
ncbi:SDR family NAD(P)-dependent oxidoreductase [Amycolatopsis rubida]|uniref:SDR family NAD(P)-dependent oxidoreductase n=1 Tax=Amycolatopsis rubida TaxID=112413 RepID=UPI001FCAFDF1|nr:SDR family oxidoreductase [Amycolatopsis rubida]